MPKGKEKSDDESNGGRASPSSRSDFSFSHFPSFFCRHKPKPDPGAKTEDLPIELTSSVSIVFACDYSLLLASRDARIRIPQF